MNTEILGELRHTKLVKKRLKKCFSGLPRRALASGGTIEKAWFFGLTGQF